MLKEIILLFALTAATKAIVCTENFCDNASCEEIECEPPEVKKKGGICKCCDVCYTEISEGGNCAPPPYRGVPSNKECAEGLQCINDVCTRTGGDSSSNESSNEDSSSDESSNEDSSSEDASSESSEDTCL